MLGGVGRRPVLAVLVGAVAIAFSGILFRLSHVSASTGAFYRCVFALPPLWFLARLETRRYGRQRPRAIALAWLAGAFFAADLILWHNGIEQGDAVLGGDRLADLARALVAGAGLALDLDVAAALACRRHLDPAHLPARLFGRLRRADRGRVPVAAAVRRRRLHPCRLAHRDNRQA